MAIIISGLSTRCLARDMGIVWGKLVDEDPMVSRVEPPDELSTVAQDARAPFSKGYTSHARILNMCWPGLNRKGFLRFHL